MKTNTNFVNKPEGARRPVSPNQTVEEQKHNAQINNLNNMEDDNMLNNNVEYSDIDYSSECIDFDNETSINNNMEGNNMMNNKITGKPETINAIINEVFGTLSRYQENISEAILISSDNTEMLFDISAINPELHDIISIALTTRMMNPKVYGEIKCSIKNNEGQFIKATDTAGNPTNGLHRVDGRTVFRKPVKTYNVNNFIERYATLNGINTFIVLPFETLVSNDKQEVIMFNLKPEVKRRLEDELKTQVTMKKGAEKLEGIATKVNTAVKSAGRDFAPVVFDSVGTVAANTVFAVTESAKAFGNAVFRETAKYIYENRHSKIFNDDVKHSMSLIKSALDERKEAKAQRSKHDEIDYY